MGKLSDLEIKQCPAAFGNFAASFNRLLGVLSNMRGEGGITAVVSENNIVIRGSGGGAASNELHFDDGTISIDIDGSGIKLTNLATGNYAQLYTNGAVGVVRASNGKGVLIDPTSLSADVSIGAGGVDIDNGAGVTCGVGTGGVYYEDANQVIIAGSSGLSFENKFGGTLAIAASDITHDMEVKEFTGCNSGSPGNYKTIASDFY